MKGIWKIRQKWVACIVPFSHTFPVHCWVTSNSFRENWSQQFFFFPEKLCLMEFSKSKKCRSENLWFYSKKMNHFDPFKLWKYGHGWCKGQPSVFFSNLMRIAKLDFVNLKIKDILSGSKIVSSFIVNVQWNIYITYTTRANGRNVNVKAILKT